MVEPQVFCNYL